MSVIGLGLGVKRFDGVLLFTNYCAVAVALLLASVVAPVLALSRSRAQEEGPTYSYRLAKSVL